jgi:hypothetical protein
LLGHDPAVPEYEVFKTVGLTTVGASPGNLLLDPAMGATEDLSRNRMEKDLHPSQREISPDPLLAL